MFGLLRVIFIFFLLGLVYSWFKWKITGEARWRWHFYTLFRGTVVLAVALIAVLVLTRLFH